MGTRVASILAEIGIDSSKYTSGINAAGQQTKAFTGNLSVSLSESVGKFLAFGGVVAGIGATMKKQFDSYNDYVEQVRETSRALGSTSEEASRLIQISDDVGISVDSMTTSFKLAQKNGINPTVDGLAKMSDEYLNLAPGVERTKYLLDNFGRSGEEMSKILDIGSAAIRKQAAAVEDGLIVTQKAMEAQREYQIATDSLSDSWQAFSYKAMPPAINALNFLLNNLRGQLTGHRDIIRRRQSLERRITGERVDAAIKQAQAEREAADANLAWQQGSAGCTQARFRPKRNKRKPRRMPPKP